MPAITRRAPHVVNLLCVSIAGAIMFMPFDSTASKGCDDGEKCLESSVTPQSASPAIRSLTDDADDNGYPMGLVQVSLGACVLAGLGSVLLSRRAIGERDKSPVAA
jgi:hypothetical protein